MELFHFHASEIRLNTFLFVMFYTPNLLLVVVVMMMMMMIDDNDNDYELSLKTI